MIKRIGGTLRRTLLVALCLSLLLAGLPAMGEQTLTVRVGFFAFEGYHMQDERGERSGYGYEMLERLAGYGGFRYEFVGYDKGWGDMQDMLARGEIDLLTSAQKTPEREALFDFSDASIGVSSAILTVKAGDQRYMEKPSVDWDGIRVGLIDGNSRNESLAAYAAEHGFTYAPVWFESTEAMVAELKSDGDDRRIDAVLTSNLRRTDGEWILAQFDSSPFYVMVKKGNTGLLERINEAIAMLDALEPDIRTKLMSKYYAADSGNKIAFTPTERAYIESMKDKTLTAIISPDRAPYSWVEDGELRGMLYDGAKELIARSGLNIEFLEATDREQYWRLIGEDAADIRFDMEYSFNSADKDGYWLTEPYITVPVAQLTKNGAADIKTAAAPLNGDMKGNYSQVLEDRGITVTYYASVDEVVDAVLNGRADAAFLAMDTATMAVRNDETNKLEAAEVFGDEISYAVAVNQSQSPMLYSVLCKVIDSFLQSQIDEIRQSYAESLVKPFSLIGYFYDYPLHVFITAVVALSIVIFIIAFGAMSRRKKAEHEHLVQERRQNELLRDALAAAEKAGAAKSQFLSRVSHEMRTPLNAIIGFLELSKGADKQQVESYLASSDVAARQLLSVINDVLDMSSIESGKLKIASAPFNFKHMISSITNIYGTQCRQKGVSFETRISTTTEDWLIGDELRVNQVLMNLLGNAVKFTAQGHIWLTISETERKEDRIFLRFTVSDSGCGMSDEMMSRLFTPFEQESATTAKKYGGSGLGLSIVKNLVGMMDGTIKAESALGKGTSFTVDLPFRRVDVAKQIALPKTVASLRILAVDDEQTELDYISVVLKRMGVRFACVTSGEDALLELDAAQSRGDAYNVCLIDWRMPGMDVADITRRVRERYGKDVVVIVVSAYDFQQAGANAKAAGANLFLSKPLFQSSLFDLLMTLTGGEAANVEEDTTQSWDFGGRRVLLAEDNKLNQIVAKGYLAKFNVEVEVVENGKLAVDKLEQSDPGYYDAILMDIQMPVMDGFEATKAIRLSAHPDANTVPIIAQTADAFNEDITKSFSAGMNAHVSKPISPELLARALQRAFADKPPAR